MNSENKHFCLERQREKDNFMDAENKDICQKDNERDIFLDAENKDICLRRQQERKRSS